MKVKAVDKTDGFETNVYRKPVTRNRTNLNDLLKKVKEQKENEKKINLAIFFGVTSVLVIILLLFSV
tara:strand:- start:208 stop:408 length:201 start_codon:yes stop_codon:yes gene_type:complete